MGRVAVQRNLRFATPPGAQVNPIKYKAKQICRNESHLGGSIPDHTNDGTINSSQNPTFPAFISYQDGGDNGKHTGHIIQPQHDEGASQRNLQSVLHDWERILSDVGEYPFVFAVTEDYVSSCH